MLPRSSGDCAMTAQHGGGVAIRSFGGPAGSEHFILVEAPDADGFDAQRRGLEARYEQALKRLALGTDSAVFRRVFCSDLQNQAALLPASGLLDEKVAVSVVQQAPLSGRKLALLAYHIEAPQPLEKLRLSRHHLLVAKGGQQHLWSTRMCCGMDGPGLSAYDQTTQIFEGFRRALECQGGNLRDHCVRTWIYLRDVDLFYQGMVEARTRHFSAHGLTQDSHYLASTGIEGACSHRWDLVSMDAYSVLDLQPAQMSFLNDFSAMCPTRDYGVTFERGTRIGYADRAHHFISGTASIDAQGQVMNEGRVGPQLGRALDNVEAILRPGGAALTDMMYLLVYLRDPADAAEVRRSLKQRLPMVPALLVQGAVCRPEWLVEVEGVAISRDSRPDLPPF